MPGTRFTEFFALSVDPRVGIFRSASETNVCLFFLPMTVKIIICRSYFFLFDILRRITIFYERHSAFSVVVQKKSDFRNLKFSRHF